MVNNPVYISAWFGLLILDAEVAHTRGEALKGSTKKNLLVQLNSYQAFCDEFLLNYFPVDNKQICRYGQYLARTFKSPDAVGHYQSAIRTFTQGLKRVLEHEVKQAVPITPEILLKMSRVVDYTNHINMVAWVGTLIGFTMFLRKSNLVLDNMTSFDPKMQFRRKDFNLIGTNSHDGRNHLGKEPTVQTKNPKVTSPTSGKQGDLPSNVDTLYVPAGPSQCRGPSLHNMGQGPKMCPISQPLDSQNQEMAKTDQGTR